MAEAKWQNRWPCGGDVKQWMRCLISQAGAIDDAKERVSYTSFALEELARRGCLKEAVTQLEGLLRSLPGNDGFHRVLVLELGAKIHLEARDTAKMEDYLQRILATKALHTRKCDKGWEVEAVRKFKMRAGLLDASEGTDDYEKTKAAFNMVMRRIDALIDKGSKATARAELLRAEKMIPPMPEDWQRRNAYRDLVNRQMKLNDRNAAQRLARRVIREDEDALDEQILWDLGLQRQALLRIEDDLLEVLDGLASFNPNVHMFGARIKRLLLFLIKIGKEKTARHWLAQVLAEGKSWKFHERGFASAALFQSLAEVVVKLDGVDAAEQLMSLAMSDSKNERRRVWRGQEVGSAIDLLAKAGRVEKALELARGIRSPAMRRLHLVSLLAGQARWNELHEVLSEARSPLEAAKLCWSVKFALQSRTENE